MPQITQVFVYDDLEYRNGDGAEVPATEERHFTVDGKQYVTYLSEDNATRFDELFGEWTEYAQVEAPATRPAASPSRKSSGGGTSTGTSSGSGSGSANRKDRGVTAAIREWARGQSIEVNARGRIPNEVTEAYYAAHPDQRPAPAAAAA